MHAGLGVYELGAHMRLRVRAGSADWMLECGLEAGGRAVSVQAWELGASCVCMRARGGFRQRAGVRAGCVDGMRACWVRARRARIWVEWRCGLRALVRAGGRACGCAAGMGMRGGDGDARWGWHIGWNRVGEEGSA